MLSVFTVLAFRSSKKCKFSYIEKPFPYQRVVNKTCESDIKKKAFMLLLNFRKALNCPLLNLMIDCICTAY